MPVYDNPIKGLRFECDEKDCGKMLSLDFQGRTPEQLWGRARERYWLVIDESTCYCPEHAAARGQIIEFIKLRVENFGRELSSGRQAGLMSMSLKELQLLYNKLGEISNLSEANNSVIKAICDSRQERRVVENQKWDAIDPKPAVVTF